MDSKKCLIITMLLALTAVQAAAKDFVTHVTVTTYNPVSSQCDSDPLVTADGTKINHKALKSGKQRIIAVSRDLLWCLPYGTEVEVEGHGRYIVADTMHKRWTHRIDICQPVGKKNFKEENVKVTLIKKGK